MRKRNLAWGLLCLVLFMVGCRPDQTTDSPAQKVAAYDADVMIKWNTLFLEVERFAAGYRPGPAPRALALIGLANYEACISDMPQYLSVASNYQGLTIPQIEKGQVYHWPTVVNAAYAYLMTQFFPNVPSNQFVKIAALEATLNISFQGQEAFERSKTHGVAVAKAVWEWSKGDTFGHDAYKDPFGNYDVAAAYRKPGDFQAVAPGARAMFPNWGKVRTFAILEGDKLCPAPIPYSTSTTSAYYTQALEVYVESHTATQTKEGKWIGEFWSDDLINVTFSPGPRWIAIANQVYINEKVNLETAIFANVKVGMALNDAAVACWHSKYVYNVERPVTYIKKHINPDYKSALNNPLTGDKGVTPSFPAYPSGHSTMGAAGAEALSSVFGYNYRMTDRCHEGRTDFVGTPRTFDSFYEMAEENAISRVPLGVHFRMDCEQGVNLGYRVARKVNKLAWKK
jgi:hypothetical protein